jgi:hypothetical protein
MTMPAQFRMGQATYFQAVVPIGCFLDIPAITRKWDLSSRKWDDSSIFWVGKAKNSAWLGRCLSSGRSAPVLSRSVNARLMCACDHAVHRINVLATAPSAAQNRREIVLKKTTSWARRVFRRTNKREPVHSSGFRRWWRRKSINFW